MNDFRLLQFIMLLPIVAVLLMNSSIGMSRTLILADSIAVENLIAKSKGEIAKANQDSGVVKPTEAIVIKEIVVAEATVQKPVIPIKSIVNKPNRKQTHHPVNKLRIKKTPVKHRVQKKTYYPRKSKPQVPTSHQDLGYNKMVSLWRDYCDLTGSLHCATLS